MFRLKKLVTEPSGCTGCGACKRVCSKAWRGAEDREKSAIRISADGRGGFCAAVCDQCGDCMNMCSRLALTKTGDGVVRLDEKSCVGCLICAGECSRGYMRWHDDLPVPFKCIACGLCAAQCPVGALKIVEGSSCEG